MSQFTVIPQEKQTSKEKQKQRDFCSKNAKMHFLIDIQTKAFNSNGRRNPPALQTEET